jgi:MFS family permease
MGPQSPESTGRSHAQTVYPDGLPVPRRYWAIAAIILAITMSVLDSTVANVALPSIASDFHATAAESIWVINAYQVAILVALLPLAALGEIVGYRRISQVGLVVFTAASLACAFSTSLLTLSIARVIQGFGAAGIMSVNAALVRFTYPQRLLGRAIGINAFAVAVSAAIGPTIAAAVLAIAHWPWLFGVNVPIGMVTFSIALYALPDSGKSPRSLNYVGALEHRLFRIVDQRPAGPGTRFRRAARGRRAGRCRRVGNGIRTARDPPHSAAPAVRSSENPAVFAVSGDFRGRVHGADGGARGAAVRDSANRSQRG